VGCRAELHTSGGEAPLTVSLGWAPATRVAWEAKHVAGGVVPLPPVSCEGIWVRVLADDDARCGGADADGALFVSTTRDSKTVVECRLQPGR
jgi:hypothetical protein